MKKIRMNINKANEPKRRLSNFRIKEVSVVDEAANERKFLIVKNKESEDKDKKIFNEVETEKQEEKKETPTQTTNKNVEPLTFAALVMSSDELMKQTGDFYSEVKELKVSENGNYTMGPDLTGKAVSILEKLSDMLFLFGSDSTLGFAEPAFMSTTKYFNKKKDISIEKIGRPMNASRLKALENSVNELESGLSTIKELLHELKNKEEQMKKEELEMKETELQKRLLAEEAKIRKELGLGEKMEEKKDEELSKPEEKKSEENVDAQEEISKLKKEIELLKKEKDEYLQKSKEGDYVSQIEMLEKRIESLESAPASKSESDADNQELHKNKVEYIEKNGRKVRKDLWKGLKGKPLVDILGVQSKKY